MPSTTPPVARKRPTQATRLAQRRETLSHKARSCEDLTSGVATLLVAVASVGMGSAALLVRPLREAGIAPASMAFFRYAITAVVFARTIDLSAKKRPATIWGLGGGAAVAVGWIAYADALGTVDLATTGVTYMTYPIFSFLACRFVFGKQPGLRSAVGGLLVVLAAAVALGPTALLDASLMLFVAPAAFGFSIAVLTERLEILNPSERVGAVTVGATLTLAPIALSLPTSEVLPSTPGSWALLIGIAVGCGLLPMWLYGAAAPRIGPARTSVAGATELPTMFIIGALVFGESITARHLVAAAIIALSVALTPSARQTRNSQTLVGRAR